MKPTEITAYATRYESRFAAWLAFVLEWECVLNAAGQVISENDPDDPGGLTYAGIDKRSQPAFPFNYPTPKAVADVYYANYWIPSRAESLTFPVGEVVANFAVNMGRERAVELLQTAINLLPDKGQTVVDGIIGPGTIREAAKEDPQSLAALIDARADMRYRGIVGAHPRMRKFLRGWLNRDSALESWWKNLPTIAAAA